MTCRWVSYKWGINKFVIFYLFAQKLQWTDFHQILHSSRSRGQLQLRWDKADTSSFYYHTGNQLYPLLIKLDKTLSRYKSGDIEDVCNCIDELYYDVVNTLVACAKNFVPVRRKCCYKFWWDEGLDTLKEAAIESDRLWKAVGKPRFGRLTIFDNKQHARMQYRNVLERVRGWTM